MRVTLVSMPWADFSLPSSALGALSAYLHREEPDFSIICRSEHLQVARQTGMDLYHSVSKHWMIGEMFYLALLYPQRKKDVQKWFIERAQIDLDDDPCQFGAEMGTWPEIFSFLQGVLHDHLKTLAAEIAQTTDVLGLTTSMCQSFASLALANCVKAHNSKVFVVLGGAGVRRPTGISLLKEYTFIDAVVEGEGELPFLALLRSMAEQGKGLDSIPGVATRNLQNPTQLWEVPELDDLPIPDFDEYLALADHFSVLWMTPIEGSRGCWWDQSVRTGDPTRKCYFCNNSGCTYRSKSAARIAREMSIQAEKYQNTRFMFCDNVAMHHGVTDLADAILAENGEFSFFLTLRASHRPFEILRLHEAGMYRCECGVEGFSTNYLRRMNKGTSVIQILEVLKTCNELMLHNATNLIVGFPGASDQEVAETAENIRQYAQAYFPPATISRFNLSDGSTIDALRDTFGIVNVRNADDYRIGMPKEVWERLQLTFHSWDPMGPVTNWDDVWRACREWKALLESVARDNTHMCTHALYYLDGGTFLEIVDRRGGCRSVTFREPWRSLYLYCMEIRNYDNIMAWFESRKQEIADGLIWLVEERFIFHEGSNYLSLALAPFPHLSAERIRTTECERSTGGNPRMG
jgi:ribosomal peptide maturation radical SAM protein 1